MMGDTTHGSLLFFRLVTVTSGQKQIQLFGYQLGIFIKHLIEVAQAEEQNAILIAGLDLVILPLHGRYFVFLFCHFTLPFRLVLRSSSKWWSR